MTAVENEMQIEIDRLRAALTTVKREAIEKLEIAADLIRKVVAENNTHKETIVSLATTGEMQCARLAELQPLADLAWRYARGDARTSEVLDALVKAGGAEIKRRALRS